MSGELLAAFQLPPPIHLWAIKMIQLHRHGQTQLSWKRGLTVWAESEEENALEVYCTLVVGYMHCFVLHTAQNTPVVSQRHREVPIK